MATTMTMTKVRTTTTTIAMHTTMMTTTRMTMAVNTTITSPLVKLLSPDVALVAYVRLTQALDDAGRPTTRASEETRIWQKRGDQWQHVHFHRSMPS
jgi:calcium/calmodulin-dependent protein kinase (CaM kinase) II